MAAPPFPPQASAASTAGSASTNAAPPQPPLITAKYLECLHFTLQRVVPEMKSAGIAVDAQAVGAITATIFIARNQAGR